jgi:hypothetical protein
MKLYRSAKQGERDDIEMIGKQRSGGYQLWIPCITGLTFFGQLPRTIQWQRYKCAEMRCQETEKFSQTRLRILFPKQEVHT